MSLRFGLQATHRTDKLSSVDHMLWSEMMPTRMRGPQRNDGYEAKTRLCLKCRKPFVSSWPGERVCQRCKSQSNWREGAIPLNEYK